MQMKYLERAINVFYINIYDNSTSKSWKEEFESYYLFKKRVNKLKYSKKLQVTSRSNLLD
jgi:hypothetical protein